MAAMCSRRVSALLRRAPRLASPALGFLPGAAPAQMGASAPRHKFMQTRGVWVTSDGSNCFWKSRKGVLQQIETPRVKSSSCNFKGYTSHKCRASRDLEFKIKLYGSLGVALACTFTAAHIATPVLIYGADFTAKRALEREEEMEDEVELLRERLAILETKVHEREGLDEEVKLLPERIAVLESKIASMVAPPPPAPVPAPEKAPAPGATPSTSTPGVPLTPKATTACT